jgi:hypothetical protein
MKTLIFATTYVDTYAKRRVLGQWAALNRKINPDCDLLWIDSASPVLLPSDIHTIKFGGNIGHLSRGGRDGFGRAFCCGLTYACEHDYSHVFHVEGDSLFRARIVPLQPQPRVLSIPVRGGWGGGYETWIETGLIGFSTAWLRETRFVERYDWPNRTLDPSPEQHVRKLCGDALWLVNWRGARNDTGLITLDNVGEWDWITHCTTDIFDRFFEINHG